MPKDYYAELGVERGASAEQIKEAFKRMAKQHHPDVNKDSGAEEKFKKINEAYKVLSDPQKRANYDQFGDAGERFSGFSGSEDFARQDFDFGDIFENFGFGDAFSGMFGQNARGRGPSRGEDIGVNMTVSFEEAAFGTEKEFFIDRTQKCGKCAGEGTTEKDGRHKCNTCHGSGVQKRVQQTFIGTIATQVTCGKCRGTGETISKPCTKCNGTGKENVRSKIKVKVPAGIENGNSLRLSGEGNAGEAGTHNGDMFVRIFVQPHKFFKRDGKDVFVELPISFSQAALGAKIDVPTMHGNVDFKVPAGTQNGTLFRLKGQGVKTIKSSSQGDQFVKVILKTPEKLSKRERELFEQLAKEEGTGGKKGLFGL